MYRMPGASPRDNGFAFVIVFADKFINVVLR